MLKRRNVVLDNWQFGWLYKVADETPESASISQVLRFAINKLIISTKGKLKMPSKEQLEETEFDARQHSKKRSG